MPSGFLNRFKRITYSTDFLPEIDGLRFLAIFFRGGDHAYFRLPR